MFTDRCGYVHGKEKQIERIKKNFSDILKLLDYAETELRKEKAFNQINVILEDIKRYCEILKTEE